MLTDLLPEERHLKAETTDNESQADKTIGFVFANHSPVASCKNLLQS